MIPEIGGRGSWERWSGDANVAKFSEPTVEGVDYPSMGLSVARNDTASGELHVSTYAATPSHAGRATTIRITQVPDVARVRITCDDQEFTAWRPAGAGTVELELTIGEHVLVVDTGYHGTTAAADASPAESSAAPAASTRRIAVAAPPPAAIAVARSCRCC